MDLTRSYLIPAARDQHIFGDLEDLLELVYLLGRNLKRVIQTLEPLDNVAHDNVVTNSSMPEEAPWLDPLTKRLEHAQAHALNSLNAMRKALEEVEGLLRGNAKNRFEDPVRRAVKGAESIVARLDELDSFYRENQSDQVYGVRQSMLAGLTYQCELLLAEIELTEQYHAEGRPKVLTALADYRSCVRELKRLFSRLRDNPSQKVAIKILAAVDQIDDIFVSLGRLTNETVPDGKEPVQWAAPPSQCEGVRAFVRRNPHRDYLSYGTVFLETSAADAREQARLRGEVVPV